MDKTKKHSGSNNKARLSPWSKLLVEASRNRLRQNSIRIDLGAGPSAVVANMLGGTGWIAVDPNYKCSPSINIEAVQGTLADVSCMADYILFNPPALDGTFLDSEHNDYPLFNGGKNGTETREECLRFAPLKLSQNGELLLVVSSFHSPPKMDDLEGKILQDSKESFNDFIARVPTLPNAKSELMIWLQKRVQNFEEEWEQLNVKSDSDHFVITVWSFKKSVS